MQKARRRLSAPTACKRTVSGSISLPCSGFFPPFLHSTGSLSVFWEYLALRDGPRKFRQDSTCPALLRWLSRTNQLTSTGLSPSAVELSRTFQFIDSFPMITPTTPTLPKQYRFGLCRVRSPLLPTSMISFFSWGYLDVSVPPVRPIKLMVTGLQPAGLPHSDIAGSFPVCRSPALFAAYHVFLRLQKPRHPPFALVTFSLYVNHWQRLHTVNNFLLVALKL